MYNPTLYSTCGYKLSALLCTYPYVTPVKYFIIQTKLCFTFHGPVFPCRSDIKRGTLLLLLCRPSRSSTSAFQHAELGDRPFHSNLETKSKAHSLSPHFPLLNEETSSFFHRVVKVCKVFKQVHEIIHEEHKY